MEEEEEEEFSQEMLNVMQKLFQVSSGNHKHNRDLNRRKMLPKKRIQFSSFGKTSGINDDHWKYQVNLADRISNIVSIRFVSINLEYTVPAIIGAIPKSGVLFLDNFPSIGNKQFSQTSDGTRYHALFPIVSGGVGTSVNFIFEFPEDYFLKISNSKAFIETLYPRIYKEDPITNPGEFILFTDLTYTNVELEITYLDTNQN